MKATVFTLAMIVAFVPSPTVVGQDGHPGQDAVLWQQLAAERVALGRQVFVSAERFLPEAVMETGFSASLEQRTLVASGEVELRGLPVAVLLDLDETVLDNSYYQARLIRTSTEYNRESWQAWCRESAAPAIPGALEFCQVATELGVRVYYVTNRRDAVREVTRRNLAWLGFPLDPDHETVLTRRDTSDKTPRRLALARQVRIVASIGDNLGDFAGVFDRETSVERLVAVEEYRHLFGRGWFVLPNATYGAWKTTLLADRSEDVSTRIHLENQLHSYPVDAPKPPNPKAFYAEVRREGVIYVVGTPEGRLLVWRGGPLPVVELYEGKGPQGETVVVEAHPSDVSLANRLWSAFVREHQLAH